MAVALPSTVLSVSGVLWLESFVVDLMANAEKALPCWHRFKLADEATANFRDGLPTQSHRFQLFAPPKRPSHATFSPTSGPYGSVPACPPLSNEAMVSIVILAILAANFTSRQGIKFVTRWQRMELDVREVEDVQPLLLTTCSSEEY